MTKVISLSWASKIRKMKEEGKSPSDVLDTILEWAEQEEHRITVHFEVQTKFDRLEERIKQVEEGLAKLMEAKDES